jgi:hypothetical protein
MNQALLVEACIGSGAVALVKATLRFFLHAYSFITDTTCMAKSYPYLFIFCLFV